MATKKAAGRGWFEYGGTMGKEGGGAIASECGGACTLRDARVDTGGASF